MKKPKFTTASPNGTSFHGITFYATPNELKKAFSSGEGCNDGRDKVNMEWILETSDNRIFTIYDWKEYRPLDDNERIEWHIGGHNVNDTIIARKEIRTALDTLLK